MKININQQKLFFCSDPHYHHSSLVKGTSNWEDKSPCREFKTLKAHDTKLVNNINKTVGRDDVLFCLGDWNFGQYKDAVKLAKEFRKRINCKNVHLILGNHDKHIRKNKECIQDVFSSIQDYAEIQVIEPAKGQGNKAIRTDVVMSHYSMRTWNYSRKGGYMLYGHSHNTLEPMRNCRTMDVGFDTHPKFKPYSWKEIKKLLK